MSGANRSIPGPPQTDESLACSRSSLCSAGGAEGGVSEGGAGGALLRCAFSPAAPGGGPPSESPPQACRTLDSPPSPPHPRGGTILPHQIGYGTGPPGDRRRNHLLPTSPACNWSRINVEYYTTLQNATECSMDLNGKTPL